MLRIAHGRLTLDIRLQRVELVAALLLLGCGKTPDSVARASSGGGSGSGGDTSAGGDAGDRTAPDGQSSAFLCTSEAEPGDMVSVPAAPFVMGCDENLEAACTIAETPPHSVSLATFEIDRTEVTQAQYTACVLADGCDAPACEWDCANATFPAACVTWAQATAYCKWAAKRLPTEAEWEKAARGTDGRTYPWGNQDPDCVLGNVAGCGDRPEAVGIHPAGASPYGALDLAGNVVELVADFYDASYYRSSPADDPTGPPTGTRYVGRGGGFRSLAEWQRASSRDWYDATDFSEPLGFRCAR